MPRPLCQQNFSLDPLNTKRSPRPCSALHAVVKTQEKWFTHSSTKQTNDKDMDMDKNYVQQEK